MANQHYLSRFLSRAWERSKSKMLVYYDFDTDRIEEAKAKELFAQHDVHSEEIDLRFRNAVGSV